MKEQADVARASRFLPPYLQTREQVLAVMMMGQELGIPPMQSLKSIKLIQGTPSLSSELKLALIYRKYPNAKIEFTTPVDKQSVECSAVFARPGGKDQHFKFTVEDANRAGLTKNANWSKYPASMLRARVISAGASAVFPDCFLAFEGVQNEVETFSSELDEPADVATVEPVAVVNSVPNPDAAIPTADAPAEIIKEAVKNDGPMLATVRQLAWLHAVANECGWNHDGVKKLVTDHFKKASLKELTFQEVEYVVKHMKANPVKK